MKIYVLSFNDSGVYCAYTSFEKAKSVLWECYQDEVFVNYNDETKLKYLAEDLATLEEGYILDYGYIEEIPLVEG